MSNYATLKKRGKRRLCYASQLPVANDRLADSVERISAAYFTAQVLICLPGGEILAAEVCEYGKRLRVRGKGNPATVAAGVFWNLVDAIRSADRTHYGGKLYATE